MNDEDRQRVRQALVEGNGVADVTGYCENLDCIVREVKIELKDYEKTFVGDIQCPCCWSSLRLLTASGA